MSTQEAPDEVQINLLSYYKEDFLMPYQNGKLYWSISHRGTGKALSVYGNSEISQNRNVIIWDKQSINAQK